MSEVARPRSVLALIFALLSLVVSNACAAPPASVAPQTAPGQHLPVISAINGFSLWRSPQWEWGPQLAAMQREGIQMVRSDAVWSITQPQAMDAWVSALASQHLTWEPIIDYGTDRGNWRDTADYAANAQALAARYGANGSFWAQHPELPYKPPQIFELWNGENQQWLIPARLYGPLYAAVRTAVHAVDPTASVDVGGLGDDGESFVQSKDYPAWYVLQMLSADPSLKQHIDGFALHPYAPTATDALQWVIDFHWALTVWGEGSVPIDLTEFGWPTGNQSQEAERATNMRALALALANSNCEVRMVAPYDWINPIDPGDNEGDLGFVDRSATNTALRPAGVAWFTGLGQGARLPEVGLCGPVGRSTVLPTPATSHRNKKHHKNRRKKHRRPAQTQQRPTRP